MAAGPVSGDFMRILDDVEVKGTVCLNAKCAEDFPDAVKQLHDRGHEISAHSYTQDLVLPYLSAQEEKEVIQKCSRIIESVVGTRPVGWFSPVAAPTVNTARFLAEEGFLWHGDYNDTDLPYSMKCLQAGWLRLRTAILPTTERFAVAREIFSTCIKTLLTFYIAPSRHR